MSRHQPKSRIAAAFTFVELVLGIVVLSLVVGAVAALTSAAAQAWQAGEQTQRLQMAGRHASIQIVHLISSAKYVALATDESGSPSAAGGAVMYWKQDANGDERMQAGELSLLEREGTLLNLYELPAGHAVAGSVYRLAQADGVDDAAAFKALCGAPVRAIAGGLAAASFTAYALVSAGQRQVVEFDLRFEDVTQVREQRGSVAVRGSLIPLDDR